MSNGVIDLLLNVGSTGSDVEGDFVTWPGGPGDLFVSGQLGDGAIELQATLDNEVTIICILSLPVVGMSRFILNHGVKLRAVLTGVTGTASGVSARINI